MPEGPAGRQPVAETEIVGATQYGAGMADADTRIDSLKDDIRALGCSVLDLQEKATAHDAKFAEILLTLRAHGSKLDSHDRRFDQIDVRFEQVDAKLAEILARLPQRPTTAPQTPTPPTTVSSCPVNSPVSSGIARPIAAFVAGSCSEALWCSADSQISLTQITSASSASMHTA